MLAVIVCVRPKAAHLIWRWSRRLVFMATLHLQYLHLYWDLEVKFGREINVNMDNRWWEWVSLIYVAETGRRSCSFCECES